MTLGHSGHSDSGGTFVSRNSHTDSVLMPKNVAKNKTTHRQSKFPKNRAARSATADECACRSGSDADAPIDKRDGRGDEEKAFERELDVLTRAEAERM